MPRSVLITTSVLVVLAGIAGFWLGRRHVTLEATGVIDAVAARHVAERGGAVTDCVGWQGAGTAVFQVRCGAIIYDVDRFGGVSLAPEGFI